MVLQKQPWMQPGDTYIHFNEYFGLHIRKDSITNTYERLKQRLPEEICGVLTIPSSGQSAKTMVCDIFPWVFIRLSSTYF